MTILKQPCIAIRMLAGICLIGTACGDPVSPSQSVVGQVYVLVSVNGAELPHRFWENAHSANELVADTLVFRDADSVAFHQAYRWITESEEIFSSNTKARAYQQLPGGRLLISEECPGYASWCREDYVESGLFKGDRLITSIDNIDISEDRVYVLVTGG